MKKQKIIRQEKGITLIALIITIIVLLILAVVAIRAVQGDEIISHSKNTRDEYERAQTNEQTTLEGYLGKIESNIPNGSGAEIEPISVETHCIKYYADVDGDKEPDGIIYIDKAKTASGSWNGKNYTITKVTTGLKNYYISKESHTTTEYGTAPVLSLVPGSTGEERFYVMALEDAKTDANTTFYWYYNAMYNIDTGFQISEYATLTSTGIGAGKTNTANMINAWGSYGNRNERDMWGLVENGWYVPSKDEWVAFAAAFNVTSNDGDFGLCDDYYSSSLSDSQKAWFIDFSNNAVRSDFNLFDVSHIRLGTTF